MQTYRTEQEQFWASDFGNDYIARNEDQSLIAANLALFAKILNRTSPVTSALELGANIGLNLRAIRQLLPHADLEAVEINAAAAQQLRAAGIADAVHHASILDFAPKRAYDLLFTVGVLIHIAPDELSRVYDLMYRSSNRYIVVAEYYNPTPVTIPYRGHGERLFKRDFAGEIMDRFTDVSLLDYGFVYRRDPNFRHDDITWFLVEKR